jgi:hypothetical protein
MARDRKDRSGNWFMQQHGGSLLHLAPVGQVVRWRAAPTVLTFPKQIPDGLLDVTFAGKDTPDPFLIEIESYPEQDTPEQIRSDLAMVLLTRGVLPDILVLVLRPKGNLSINPEQILRSTHGLTEWHLKIEVVNLWTVPVEKLLAIDDVGMTPWLVLAQYDCPAEDLLRLCRERIDTRARPEEKDNLLAVTRVMAEMRYNQQQLLAFLGGEIMSLDKVFLESPTVQRLVAQRVHELVAQRVHEAEEKSARETTERVARETTERVARETMQAAILRVLNQRFAPVPTELAEQLRALQDQQKLTDLLDLASTCANLQAFRSTLTES